MKEETSYVDCSFCGKSIPCPDNMLQSEKHMCSDCIDDKRYLELKGGSKVHFAIPNEEFADRMANAMVDELLQNEFPEIWKNAKDDIKEMSKKQISEEMFSHGAYVAARTLMETLKTMDEKNNIDINREKTKKDKPKTTLS